MSLYLSVGMLADLRARDVEGAAHLRKDFDTLNRYLLKRNLPVHFEPERCEYWSADMWSYSGLHYVRRLAAHFEYHGKLPSPGDEQAAKDSLLQSYYRTYERGDTDHRFNQLIIHSDAEGYYLPVELPFVLFPGDEYVVAGGYVGSAPRLLRECIQLAQALRLPLDTSPTSEEVLRAAQTQEQTEGSWRSYGIECFTLLRLMHGAAHSVRTGAALVFG